MLIAGGMNPPVGRRTLTPKRYSGFGVGSRPLPAWVRAFKSFVLLNSY